jgi:hypothetical protein
LGNLINMLLSQLWLNSLLYRNTELALWFMIEYIKLLLYICWKKRGGALHD